MTRRPVYYVALDLPRPISNNDLWRPNGRGGIRCTDVYKAWKEEAGYCINAMRLGAVKGPYALTLRVSEKWRGDLGNAEKAVSDLLQEHQIIENDRLCQRLLVERASVPGLSVLVASTSSSESVQ